MILIIKILIKVLVYKENMKINPKEKNQKTDKKFKENNNKKMKFNNYLTIIQMQNKNKTINKSKYKIKMIKVNKMIWSLMNKQNKIIIYIMYKENIKLRVQEKQLEKI